MGSYVSERKAIGSLLAPIDKNGATVATQGVNLSNYQRATFILSMGNMATIDTVTLIVKANTAYTNGGTAIDCRYRVATAGAAGISVVDGALTALLAAGLTIADGQDNKVYVIEVLASDVQAVGAAYKFANLNISSPGSHACLESIVYVMSDARYPQALPVDPSS